MVDRPLSSIPCPPLYQLGKEALDIIRGREKGIKGEPE